MGFLQALRLCWLFIFRPSRFSELENLDNLTLKINDTRESAEIVRGAFVKSFFLVIAFAIAGYVTAESVSYFRGCASARLTLLLQIVGAGMLLWGTLFVRGWEILTYNASTLTERVNQWLYRGLYCLGTAILVCSLAWPSCSK